MFHRTGSWKGWRSRPWLVEVLLEAGKDVADLFRSAQVGYSVGNSGAVVLELQQRCQLVAIQLFDADLDVLREHKVEEDLLPGVEVGADPYLSLGGPLLTGERRQGVGNVRQHVEKVALLGVDYF